MRVPEAVSRIDAMHQVAPSQVEWIRELTKVLDDVWLAAYEECREKMFESPPGQERHGRHERLGKTLPNQ